MIQFLSLVLSFILLFFAGSSLPAQSSSAQAGHEVKDCCRQEAAEENTADCCKQETAEEAVPDCCAGEAAKEDPSQGTPDCCGPENGKTESCCQEEKVKEETSEKSIPDNIPDCCGA